MGEATITVTLTPGLGEDLAEIARREGRSAESVALDAITEHVAVSLEMRASILRGEADVAAGRTVAHEEVMADLARMLDDADRAKGQ
ncbi:CopG family ribbon-helix-helix protein [Roseicella aquatilis]|uniref:CopG family transcriptional regulator n=1 Tax=Roseicella aquatilis TaxID=2527868 RepID=A0A4R4DHJ0_9PROT|nr:CopG family transcriptional regulator [Roseicella aquatilis]TCZ59812.1 CopG family transcriptional regulator [Roseicella aquatilis]